jgi:ribonuclease E
MTKRMLIDASHPEETRVVVLDGTRLEEFDLETAGRKPLKGNIYLARVVRVEPSLQAAFVEYGGNRHGFLAFGEIHPDYYQIPVADRQRLLAMQAEEAREAAAAEEAAEAEAETPAPREPRRRERRRGRRSDTRREVAEALATAGTGDPAEAAGEAITPLGLAEPAPDGDAAQHAAPADMAADPHPANGTATDAPGDEAPPSQATPAAEDAPPAPAEDTTPPDGEPSPRGTRAQPMAMADDTRTADAEPTADDEDDDEDEGDDAPGPELIGGTTEEEARERRPPPRFMRNYKIQEVIRRRQIMLVQVVKEERGGKGAALTTYISLAGRFSVLMPNSPRAGGVSRKITSIADRKRLRETIDELGLPDGMSMIVRTAGAARPKPEIMRDGDYLLKLWDDIRERTLASTAPALIYEEADLLKRSIRDVLSRDVEEVHVEGEAAFQEAREFTRLLMPSQEKKIRLYNDRTMPLFARHGVEAQLDAMMSPVVQLKSGGTIVIHQTEALVAIDVNSGRATRDRHIEDTALKVNIEAAEEIARQLRLRDLAGLIVIDFIDMESAKHDGLVEKRLKDALKQDRARIQVGRISHFGLLEMSRQRLRPSLTEQSFITCPHCKGLGIVRSPESAALQVLRAIEEEGAKRRAGEIMVRAAPGVVLHILNRKRDRLVSIERNCAMTVLLEPDEAMFAAEFRIERTRAPAPLASPSEPAPALRMDYAAEPEAAEAEAEADVAEAPRAPPAEGDAGAEDRNGDRRRRRRRRRRGRRDGLEPGTGAPGSEDDAEGEEGDEPEASEAAPDAIPEPEPEVAPQDPAPRGRRPRTRRREEASERPAPTPRPTPADPFAGTLDDIFEAMEAMEQAAEAEATRPKPSARPATEPGTPDVAEPMTTAAGSPEPTAPQATDPGAAAPAATDPDPAPAASTAPAAPAAGPVAAPPIQPVPVEQAADAPRRRGWWSR